jgi:GNAT superfamily N-acetyltransferase
LSSPCVRDAEPIDRTTILALLNERWGGETIVVHQTVYQPADLPALKAVEGVQLVGLVTYMVEPESSEVVTIDSLVKGRATGTTLLDRVETVARANNCQQTALVTTNGNLDAIRFYKRRGYRITAIDFDGVVRLRKLKPSIPRIGDFEIPIRDELTLAKQFDGAGAEARSGRTS